MMHSPILKTSLSASLVIPNQESLPMLRKALAFIDHLQGIDLELVIVDHQSRDPELHSFYRELDMKVPFRLVRYERGFNYSLMINAGVEASTHPIVVMMNNDVEITHSESFLQLVRHAVRPAVGVLGSKLLYSDNSIQHCGVALLEGGHADHILRHVSSDDLMYQKMLSEVREYHAVTGALMACRREVFDAVEGFNEVYLPIEYNDIDFCLKVRERGLKVICLPLEDVYHHESVSRGKELDAMGRLIRSEASRYMSQRWSEEYSRLDPFLDPRIDYFPNRLHPAGDVKSLAKSSL
jgi:glycosyltransferase involved in cell wall biosynthesis